MNSMNQLRSSRDCIEHAQYRINELEAACLSFANTSPYVHVVDINADGTQDSHKIKLAKPLPRKISMIAFEILVILRSALDQAGHAVAKATHKRGRHAKFPFGDSLPNVRSLHARGSRDLPNEIFDLMTASGPYPGGNDILWAINHLANTNKHEIIVPSVVTIGAFSTESVKVPGRLISLRIPPKWDSANDEMELVVVARGEHVEYNCKFGMFIALADIDFLKRTPAQAALLQMKDIVNSLVVAIEAEARRLGIFT